MPKPVEPDIAAEAKLLLEGQCIAQVSLTKKVMTLLLESGNVVTLSWSGKFTPGVEATAKLLLEGQCIDQVTLGDNGRSLSLLLASIASVILEVSGRFTSILGEETMTTVNIAYGSNAAITFDISSLAGSVTFVAGRECSEIDNTGNLYVDAIVNVEGITGHASTAPTIGQIIQLYAWGADTSLGTTPIDVLDGTDSAETLAHVAVRNGLRLAGSASVTVGTAALRYYIMPFSVAQLFGGIMPKFWGLFLTHNHTGALASTQSTRFSYNGITYTNA